MMLIASIQYLNISESHAIAGAISIKIIGDLLAENPLFYTLNCLTPSLAEFCNKLAPKN